MELIIEGITTGMGIFPPGKEIKGLGGGVRPYAA